MAHLNHTSFLLVAFGLYLGVFLPMAEAASCPAEKINASDMCGDVERLSIKTMPNLTNVVCDNFENLTQFNSTFILQALEYVFRKRDSVPIDIARVLFNQVDGKALETALEEFNQKIVNSSVISNVWKTIILRALWEEKIRNEDRFNETGFVTSWFQKRLRLFLSVISTDMLQCLHNETMGCAQYQAIVKGLDAEFTKMNHQIQEDVFDSFQFPYLNRLNSNGSACARNLNSTSWLNVNFGRFSQYAKYKDLVSLNSRFDGLEVLQNLTVKQLAQLSATSGALKTSSDVKDLVEFIESSTLAEYMDEFNRQINVSLPKDIQAGLLEMVLRAAQPILQNADDAEFAVWMEQRLPPLIPGMNSTFVRILFNHLEARNCSAVRTVATLLNSSIGEFSNATRQSIYEAILGVISNSSLRCYSTNSSFSAFLEEMLQGYADFLSLKDLENLIPTLDLQETVNTIPPDALADLFSREGFLNNNNFMTAVLQNYKGNGAFIDKFNEKDIIDRLPNGTKSALLAGVWPTVVSDGNATEVTRWLDHRLAPYLKFLSGEILNTTESLNASCVTFRKLVSVLNANISMFKEREEELYYSIKAYLTATSTKPRCYNASDPETSDWLVTYLGSYIRYSRARDMRLLTNHSTAIFQDLVLNPDNLELINKTKIHKDLAEMYADALFMVDSDFSLDSLPDQLICFARHSTLISSLSPREVLELVAQVNLYCSSSHPSASDRQLATMLVAQIKTFDGPTLVALGQQAMGLTAGQISDLSAQDLVDPKVLESLGQVNGWNRGQTQGLVNKILRSNFTLDTAEKFERLGTLTQGLLSNTFDEISADLAIGLAKNASFVNALKQGPEYLKKAFVSKILSNSSSLSDILDNVPDDLAEKVPNSLLVFGGKTPDLQKINEKRWSSQQAAVLFGDVLSSTKNYTELSAFILQGFQCNAASKLTPGQLSFLVQEIKIKNASLSDDQLSCMAKLLSRSNLTANFTHYPADVLLFFPLDKVEPQSCESFYALAARGNLSLLANGSTQRTKLLENALSCFEVVNTSLTKEKLQTLGSLVCDMDAASIEDSDPGIVENLKLCPDLTESQRTSLNVLLSSGRTSYGIPASWDDGTLEALGPLAFYINHTTWDLINKEERVIYIGNVADAFDSQTGSQKKKTIDFLKSIGSKPDFSPRTKRAPEDCQSSPITTSILEDSLFIIHYDTVQQFDACLSNEVLKANLVPLLEQPLPNNYLAVMKRKLNEIYPNGIPEDQLKLLGFLSRQYSADEIGKWNVTSSDTLAILLNRENGAWERDQLRRLVARYTELGGTLTGPLLDILEGKYLCFLDEDQLKQINPESIRHAEKLDISSCSQGKKDILYEKAHTAFASQDGSSAYYPLIQPYLGGAPVEDLKKLAGSRVAMDINTFVNLKPEELQKLSVRDVRGLLGVNLPDLKGVENNPSIVLWIKSHFQSELDTLRIGLRGGMTSLSSTAASSSVASTSMASNSTDTPTADIHTIPITESTISFSSDAATSRDVSTAPSSTTFRSLDPEFHSTPHFRPTFLANETSYASTEPINTHVPTVAVDPRIVFSSEIPAMPSDTTSLTDKPISRAPVSTFVEDNNTTFPEITVDSNSVTTSSGALSTVPTEPTLAAPTEAITTFSNITVASDDAPIVGFIPTMEADVDMTISVKTTATTGSTRTTGLLTTVTDSPTATSPTPPISTIHPIRENTTRVSNTTSAMPTMTATSSGSTLAPSEHMPNVTASSPVTPATEMKDKATTAPGKTTVQDPKTSHRTSVPPGLISSHTAVAPAPTKRDTTRSTPKRKPPSYPTPNGYINVQPLHDSSGNPSVNHLLLTLHLLVGITVQRKLL